MGRAVAPMRKRWPDTSRHGPRRGCVPGAANPAPAGPPSAPYAGRGPARAAPARPGGPPRQTGARGGAGGLVMVSSATRSSRVRCTSVSSGARARRGPSGSTAAGRPHGPATAGCANPTPRWRRGVVLQLAAQQLPLRPRAQFGRAPAPLRLRARPIGRVGADDAGQRCQWSW